MLLNVNYVKTIINITERNSINLVHKIVGFKILDFLVNNLINEIKVTSRKSIIKW